MGGWDLAGQEIGVQAESIVDIKAFGVEGV